MAKKVSKQSKQAQLNINFEIDGKQANKAKKSLKRTPMQTLIVAVVVLLVGALVGAGATYLLTRNDCFELVGEEEIECVAGETFADEGVKIVAFNKDESKNVKIETDLLRDENGLFYSDEIGTHYIIYTTNNFKYGKLFKIKKIRLVHIVEESDDDIPEVTNG